jgi:hypothetical protein
MKIQLNNQQINQIIFVLDDSAEGQLSNPGHISSNRGAKKEETPRNVSGKYISIKMPRRHKSTETATEYRLHTKR